MNTQDSVWAMAQVPPGKAVIMSKAILFWKKAFLIRDIQCSVRTVIVSYHFCNVLQTNGGNKEGTQMTVSVENRTYPASLEERETGSFGNLTWLYTPYITIHTGREAALVGLSGWTGGGRCQTRTPTSSPLSMAHVPFQSSWVSTTGSQWRLNSSSSRDVN